MWVIRELLTKKQFLFYQQYKGLEISIFIYALGRLVVCNTWAVVLTLKSHKYLNIFERDNCREAVPIWRTISQWRQMTIVMGVSWMHMELFVYLFIAMMARKFNKN